MMRFRCTDYTHARVCFLGVPPRRGRGRASAIVDLRISVCLPARDEAATVGDVVAAIPDELVDEIVVVDDGSTDATVHVAARAGARVVSIAAAGKGAAMRRGLQETTGDIVVYLDADVRNFEAHFVTGLVGPLLHHDDDLAGEGHATPDPPPTGRRVAAGSPS